MPAGIEIDGVSQIPALTGRAAPRDTLFGFWPNYTAPSPTGQAVPAAWIRQGRYKLVRYFYDAPDGAHRHKLYDLETDRGETTDLAARFPERVRELSKKLSRHFEETGAVTPVPNPGYDPDAVKPERK